jgi:spoIIIJ-associated protein
MTDLAIQRGSEWLEELLKLAQMPSTVTVEQVAVHGDEAVNYWLTIDETKLTEDHLELLLGEEGAILDSIQYIANSVLNLHQEENEQASYTIELNGYRVKRQAELKAMAESVVEIVRQTGQEVEMKYLSSAERRQVHTFLTDYEDLESFSRGQEPDRRLVVKLR